MFDKKVREFLGLGKTTGDFGIEIEMEFDNFIPQEVSETTKDIWRWENDGSLRGISSELVTKKPHPKANIPKLIGDLSEKFEANNVKILDSIRAGVHVHMNMQECTIGDVFRLIAVYLPLETVITDWCGKGRQGNLFCLRSRDAYGMTEKYLSAVTHKDLYELRTDELRYCSMNLQSLFLYGSVEFRALATSPDLSNIIIWCDLLDKLKQYALKGNSVWEITSEISGMGPRSWAESVLGKGFVEMLDSEDFEKDILEDLRNNQHLLSELSVKGL